MNDLLDYLLYALFGHNVTSVRRGSTPLAPVVWTICFEGSVYITLDEHDLLVIKQVYDERCPRLKDDERARYEKIFNACV